MNPGLFDEMLTELSSLSETHKIAVASFALRFQGLSAAHRLEVAALIHKLEAEESKEKSTSALESNVL